MFKRKQTNLDERQLWQRGNVFQHGFLFFILALGAQSFCRGLGVAWAEGGWESILILWGGITLCWWEFILRDIYPLGRRQAPFFWTMGLCGLLCLGLSLFQALSGQGAGIFQGGMLSQRGAIALIGCMMASILLAHLVKSFRERRDQSGED